MKNIKNILIIFSLLAAPVAFGCSECERMKNGSTGNTGNMPVNAPRSMSQTAKMGSGYGSGAGWANSMESSVNMSGGSMKSMGDSKSVNRPMRSMDGGMNVAPKSMSGKEMKDMNEAYDADYGYNSDSEF